MKKILLPIDGSPRSLRTIQEIKQSYDPKETEITILLVTPEPRPHKMTDDNDEVKPMPERRDQVRGRERRRGFPSAPRLFCQNDA